MKHITKIFGSLKMMIQFSANNKTLINIEQFNISQLEIKIIQTNNLETIK